MEEYLKKLCGYITSGSCPRMDYWQWGQGVCIYALGEAYKKNKDKKCLDYIFEWLKEHIERKQPGMSVNTTTPLNGVLTLYEITGNDEYMQLCHEFAEYIVTACPRCDLGALEHTCTESSYPNQAWVDTVFMGGIFLARYGSITHKKMYINEALRQLVLHYDFLCDEKTGLLHHGYDCNDRTKHGALWGRGNAWFASACPTVLSYSSDDMPLKKELEKRYLAHLNAIMKYQRNDGSWGTIINDETSYSETTGTSGMAYGIAKGISMGYIEKKYCENRDKAYAYLKERIAGDGSMTGGSDGTCVSDDMNVYKSIKISCSEFSQGLAILAFTI